MGHAETVLQKGIRFEGALEADESVDLAGELEGELEVRGRLTVKRRGRVRADVEAHQALILGTVEGDVHATDLAELGPKAKMDGNIRARRILISDGARLTGNVDMEREVEALTDYIGGDE